MHCERVTKLLSDHVDGRLSARLTIDIEQHLEQCHACMAVANDLRKTVHVLHGMPAAELSDGFDAALAARLASLTPASRRRARLADIVAALRRHRARLCASAGALCAAAVLTVVMLPLGPIVRPPAPEAPRPAAVARTVQNQHMVLTAADPLEDVAAANLATYDDGDGD